MEQLLRAYELPYETATDVDSLQKYDCNSSLLTHITF